MFANLIDHGLHNDKDFVLCGMTFEENDRNKVSPVSSYDVLSRSYLISAYTKLRPCPALCVLNEWLRSAFGDINLAL